MVDDEDRSGFEVDENCCAPTPCISLDQTPRHDVGTSTVSRISNQHSPIADLEYRYKNIYWLGIFQIGDRGVLIADPRNTLQNPA